MHPLAFVSARYWRRRPARVATTVAGIALGVAMIVSVGLINAGILRSYRDLAVTLAGSAQFEMRALGPSLPDGLLDRVRVATGVGAAVPILEQRSVLFFRDTRHLPLLLRGVDPEADHSVRPLQIVAGHGLGPEDANGIVLAAPLAATLRAGPGDTLEVLTPEGLVAFRVVGTFGGLESLSAPQSRVALVPLQALQAAYRGGAAEISQIDVALRPDADPAQVAAALEGLAAGAALVQRPLERARQLAELSEGVRFMLLLAAAMALVAAAFLIGTNALAAVNERRGDLATLRAMGLGRRTLTAWILTELAVLGVAGSTAGAVLGPVVANALTNVAASQALGGRLQGLGPLELEWSVLAVGLASGVLSAVLAAWPAARWAAGGRGSQVGPNPRPPGATGALGGTLVLLLILLATRMAVLPARSSSVAGVTVGLLALVLAAAWLPLVVAGVGASLRDWASGPLWLRLAADNLGRHRRRTGAVAASLMVTLAILVGVSSLAASYRSSVAGWVDEMFGWDLMVTGDQGGLQRTVPLDEALRARLERVPGVRSASPERVALIGFEREALTAYAYDFASGPGLRRFDSVDGVPGPELPAALTGRHRAAVSTVLAARHGLTPGGELVLQGAAGPVHLEVVAVVRDPGAPSGAIYLDREIYAASWRDRSVDAFAVRLEPGADPQAVTAAVQRELATEYPVQVVSAAGFKAALQRALAETFVLSQGLVLVAVLMALFGLLNAGMISVWQLRRQLAVLLALGAPRQLLARALLAEAWLMGVVGGAAGVAMGTLLGGVLLRSLRFERLPVASWDWPVGAYGFAAAVALLGSLAVGYLPSRAAQRTPLSEALRR